MLSIRFVSRLVRCAAPVLLSFFAFALHIQAQKAPSASTLTVNSGQAPANLTCTVGGMRKPGVPAPSGTVTFTDLTENQTLGAATLAGPAAFALQQLGTTSPSVQQPAYISPLATGDFNGDGILDIAFSYTDPYNTLQAAVMLGNGDGTFQAPSTVGLGRTPSSPWAIPAPIVADVNGDTKPDLIIAYANNGDIYAYILLGNGDGTLQAPIPETWTGIGSMQAFAAGDFNGDGHVDLAVITASNCVSNNCNFQAWILNGDGSGNFTPSKTSYSLASGDLYQNGELRVADLRKDGKLDLIVFSSAFAGPLQILLGNGDGTFAPAQLPPAPPLMVSFEIADLNQDGFPDIVAYGQPPGQGAGLQILLGNGDGTFNAGDSYSFPSSAAWMTVFTGDFHGNGHQDVLLYPAGWRTLTVYTGAGDGTFIPAGSFDLLTTSGMSPQNDQIVPGDFEASGPGEPATIVSLVANPGATLSMIVPTQTETATLPPYTFAQVAPATRSLQCSYAGNSYYSGSVSPAVSYVIPDAAALTTPAPGSVLPGPQVTFSWTAGIGATGYILYLGTTVGAYNISSTGLTTATSIRYTALPTNGETIYARLYTVFPNRGEYSVHSDYVFTAEKKESSAALTSPAPNSVLPGPQATVSWTPGVGATGYVLYLGTTPGAYDITSSGSTTATSIRYTALPTNGETIYARLYTVFPDHGEYSVRSDYVFTALKETPAAMTSPAPNSVLPGPQATFSWTAGSGATGYILYLGTTPGAYDITSTGVITATSVNYSALPTNGETIYARLYTVFPDHGEYSVHSDYVLTALKETPATLTSPAPNSVLPGPQATVSWTPGVGATGYVLYLGTTPGAYDITSSGSTTATSIRYTALPTNGETIYARLYTVFPDHGEYGVRSDYVFTALKETPAAITSPAPNSVLPGPQVTFTWSAGVGATGYILYLGATPGAYNITSTGVITATSMKYITLPTNGETIYARLYTVFPDHGEYSVRSDYVFTAAVR